MVWRDLGFKQVSWTTSEHSTHLVNGTEISSNKDVFFILQSSNITGSLLSDCLMSYTEHSLGWGGSYLLIEMMPVYFTAQADWSKIIVVGPFSCPKRLSAWPSLLITTERSLYRRFTFFHSMESLFNSG